LELEAPPNDWFAGTVAVTRAKREPCGKPSLAARGMFEAQRLNGRFCFACQILVTSIEASLTT
jgi:hypothetical protein